MKTRMRQHVPMLPLPVSELTGDEDGWLLPTPFWVPQIMQMWFGSDIPSSWRRQVLYCNVEEFATVPVFQWVVGNCRVHHLQSALAACVERIQVPMGLVGQ
jgi:hypothetical protein